jgi:hypothetical protein
MRVVLFEPRPRFTGRSVQLPHVPGRALYGCVCRCQLFLEHSASPGPQDKFGVPETLRGYIGRLLLWIAKHHCDETGLVRNWQVADCLDGLGDRFLLLVRRR